MRTLLIKNFTKLSWALTLFFAPLSTQGEGSTANLEPALQELSQYMNTLDQPVWLSPVDLLNTYYIDAGEFGIRYGDKITQPEVHPLAEKLTDAIFLELQKTDLGAELLQKFNSKEQSLPHVFSYILIPPSFNKEQLREDQFLSSNSTSTNLTLVFLEASDLQPTNLILSLAHEMAILLDTKNILYPSDMMPNDDHELLSAIANPEVQQAMTVLRAIQIEQKIFNELQSELQTDFMKEYFNDFFQKSCIDQLHLAIIKMSFQRDIVWRIYGLHYDLWFSPLELRQPEESQSSFLERRRASALQKIASSSMKTSDGLYGPACEILLQPQLGTDGTYLNRGPRPRWTEW